MFPCVRRGNCGGMITTAKVQEYCMSQRSKTIYPQYGVADFYRYSGQYAVIDVEQKKYRVDPDRLVAIEKAQKDFGDKLFYIVQACRSANPQVS
jgi:hypothetical protein